MSRHHLSCEPAGSPSIEQAARLASMASIPDGLRERVSEALAELLTAAARLEELGLDGIERASRRPIWR